MREGRRNDHVYYQGFKELTDETRDRELQILQQDPIASTAIFADDAITRWSERCGEVSEPGVREAS